MVTAFAKRGFDVTAVDVNPATVRKINCGQSPIDETGVQDLLNKCKSRIRATPSVEDAVSETDVSFVVVATPSRADGAFSNDQVLGAIEQIGHAFRDKRGYHVVALTSTVMPGATEKVIRPLLERTSGRKCGRDFGLVYNPEFIALGSVVHDFLNPDFILVGECDARAGRMMEKVYGMACENNAPVARMKPVEAEVAKISLNCYCTTKIAFANMLGEIAEKVPGADAAVIAQAIGLDRRIGRSYLRPGLGFGGPCFPRDNVAFRAFASNLRIKAPIPDAVHASNVVQAARVMKQARRLAPQGGKVAVLGLSYKPHTSVVEESQSLEIAATLARGKKYAVSVYDPMAMEAARPLLEKKVTYAKSVESCLKGADLCILAMSWPEFAKLTAAKLKRLMRVPRVIDCWRCMNPREAARLEYHAVGLG